MPVFESVAFVWWIDLCLRSRISPENGSSYLWVPVCTFTREGKLKPTQTWRSIVLQLKNGCCQCLASILLSGSDFNGVMSSYFSRRRNIFTLSGDTLRLVFFTSSRREMIDSGWRYIVGSDQATGRGGLATTFDGNIGDVDICCYWSGRDFAFTYHRLPML